MLKYLSNIFVDLFKVYNTKLKYKSKDSDIKSKQTFSKYYIEFLQLANNACILKEDQRDNLINKITLSLQKALIAKETEYTNYQSLTEYLIGLDQYQCI